MNLRRSRPRSPLIRIGGPSLALTLALGVFAPAARAQSWPTSDPAYNPPGGPAGLGASAFGAEGQMAITSDFHLDLDYVSQSLRSQSTSGSAITVAPNLMVFVLKNLAVGGRFSYAYRSSSVDSVAVSNGRSQTDLAIGPLVGYNAAIAPRVSLFPLLGLLYDWRKLSSSVAGGEDSDSGHSFTLVLKVPVLFHPFPHVFIGFGPALAIDLTSSYAGQDAPKTTTVGLTLDIGLWL